VIAVWVVVDPSTRPLGIMTMVPRCHRELVRVTSEAVALLIDLSRLEQACSQYQTV